MSFPSLFGPRSKDTVAVEFPTVSNLAGVVSFEEPDSDVELYQSTDRKQVDRKTLVGRTVGSIFSEQYGGNPPAAYVMLKGGASLPIAATYVIREADISELSQIKSTSQAASLA